MTGLRESDNRFLLVQFGSQQQMDGEANPLVRQYTLQHLEVLLPAEQWGQTDRQ